MLFFVNDKKKLKMIFKITKMLSLQTEVVVA